MQNTPSAQLLRIVQGLIEPQRLKLLCKVPTLIIWGRNGTLIPIEYLELFRQLLPNAIVEVIENAGHTPFSEKPAVVYEITRKFLTEI